MKTDMIQKIIFVASVFIIIGGLYIMNKGEREDCYQELVCDVDKLFAKDQSKALEEYHKALLERYDIDFRVVTGKLSPEQVVAVFKAADVGKRSKERKGLLFLIDPKGDKVRLEVSAGLDAVYTDGFVAYIEQKQMIPFFKANRVSDGILATTEMLIARAQDAGAGKEFIPPSQLPQNLSIGAGAQAKAYIGTGYESPPSANSTTGQGSSSPKEMSPEGVVQIYHKALAEGNMAYDLPIYSLETQKLRQNWVVTPAQMKNELNAYKKCSVDKSINLKNKGLAVIRYKVDQRKCAPYFLVMENGAWKLDFVTMMNNIRFNVDNDWHLDMRRVFPYADAFVDWGFDKNGFPFVQKMRWGITVTTNNNVTFIKKIYPNTPASYMALQENDVILSWDVMEKPDHKQVKNSMDSIQAGKIIKVQVLRNGQPLILDLIAPPKI